MHIRETRLSHYRSAGHACRFVRFYFLQRFAQGLSLFVRFSESRSCVSSFVGDACSHAWHRVCPYMGIVYFYASMWGLFASRPVYIKGTSWRINLHRVLWSARSAACSSAIKLHSTTSAGQDYTDYENLLWHHSKFGDHKDLLWHHSKFITRLPAFV